MVISSTLGPEWTRFHRWDLDIWIWEKNSANSFTTPKWTYCRRSAVSTSSLSLHVHKCLSVLTSLLFIDRGLKVPCNPDNCIFITSTQGSTDSATTCTALCFIHWPYQPRKEVCSLKVLVAYGTSIQTALVPTTVSLIPVWKQLRNSIRANPGKSSCSANKNLQAVLKSYEP